MHLVSGIQFLLLCPLYIHVYEADIFPVTFAAVIETSNKIAIGVADTAASYGASVNDTG
jgi:hypothetical protein